MLVSQVLVKWLCSTLLHVYFIPPSLSSVHICWNWVLESLWVLNFFSSLLRYIVILGDQSVYTKFTATCCGRSCPSVCCYRRGKPWSLSGAMTVPNPFNIMRTDLARKKWMVLFILSTEMRGWTTDCFANSIFHHFAVVFNMTQHAWNREKQLLLNGFTLTYCALVSLRFCLGSDKRSLTSFLFCFFFLEKLKLVLIFTCSLCWALV